ncbi:PTS transporter subunit EIIC [Catelliglobosispora koreensis]|uniref:PTS transporter subunit EIIC n=1 Tax=Catelliglobosispora koreensis TaxID=129052 RepID=UPI00036C85E3|nr:PTS transporter subunit EIIC [Catelliglobosispora koreensis]
MTSVFGVLQRVGRSLMMPIAVLPIAGLLLGLGRPDLARRLGLPPDNPVSQVLLNAGEVVFDHLPLLFAVGVAIGFARKADGTTGLAAVVGFLVFDAVYDVVAEYNKVNDELVTMGILGGIVMGLVTALLYDRFHRTKLPSYLAFFGGRRLVPILAGLAAVVNGVALGLLWPVIGRGFSAVGNWIVAYDTVGAGVYGLINRLLVPLGLHHIPNSLVWFTFGEFEGKTGDLNRFFAGDPQAGGFMTGFFPIMMFALPAACLAMIHTARPERRKAITGLLGSAALTSFLTGITEPIEFAFVFVAPVLYGVHAVLTGLSMVIMNALGVRDGFTFSAGFIDWSLNFANGNHEKPWLIFLVGPIYAAVYYSVFRFMIVRFDLKTPGREPEEEPVAEPKVPAGMAHTSPA